MAFIENIAIGRFRSDCALWLRYRREIQQLRASASMLKAANPDKVRAVEAVTALADERDTQLGGAERKLLAQWPEMRQAYAGDEYVVKIRDKEIRTSLVTRSLSGTPACRDRVPARLAIAARTVCVRRAAASGCWPA